MLNSMLPKKKTRFYICFIYLFARAKTDGVEQRVIKWGVFWVRVRGSENVNGW